MGGLFHRWRHPVRSYLICALPRSGSNLLSDGLTLTRRAGRPNQYFWPPFEKVFRERHYLDPEISFEDYVRAIVRGTSTSNEVFGFKVMAWYLNDFLARLRATAAFGEDATNDLVMLRNAFPRLRLIQIVRRNKLRQAISKARASQTGLWKVMPGKTEARAAEFDRELIVRCLQETEDGEKIWSAFFQRSGIKPFRVEYEQLCENYAETMHGVFDFLRIRLPRAIKITEPVTVRQSDALSAEWERRYRVTPNEAARRARM